MNSVFKIFFLLNLLVSSIYCGDISLNIFPSVIEKDVKSGEEFSFNVNLQNMGIKRLNLTGLLTNFTINDDGVMLFGEKYNNRSCLSWLDFYPKKINITAGTKKTITINGRVPLGTHGGYYALILFDLNSEYSNQQKGQIEINVMPGVIIALNVKFGERIEAEINTFEIKQQSNITVFKIKISNLGNIHIRPKGSLVIYDSNDKITDRLPLDKNNFILPGSSRIFQFIWNNSHKRISNESYIAECRFYIKGFGKSLNYKKNFSIFEN